MNRFGLTDSERGLVCDVLRRHEEVTAAKIFGSRAKGNFEPNSDIDLALWGNISLRRWPRLRANWTNCHCPTRLTRRLTTPSATGPCANTLTALGRIFTRGPANRFWQSGEPINFEKQICNRFAKQRRRLKCLTFYDCKSGT